MIWERLIPSETVDTYITVTLMDTKQSKQYWRSCDVWHTDNNCCYCWVTKLFTLGNSIVFTSFFTCMDWLSIVYFENSTWFDDSLWKESHGWAMWFTQSCILRWSTCEIHPITICPMIRLARHQRKQYLLLSPIVLPTHGIHIHITIFMSLLKIPHVLPVRKVSKFQTLKPR